MSIAAEIERLQTAPKAQDDVSAQLEAMRRLREQQGGPLPVGAPVGVDRSRDLSPVARPTIVRTLALR